MKVLTIILAVLFIIAIIPVGVAAVYDHDGFVVYVKAAFFKIQLYPLKNVKKKKREEKPEKDEQETEEREEGGGVIGFKDILKPALKAGSRFKRSLTINKLIIHYTAAANDAYTAAMEYGAAWAFIGIITPTIENNFRVKQRDLQANVDFNAQKPLVYAAATLTIHIWQIIYISIGFAASFLKVYFKNKKRDGITERKD